MTKITNTSNNRPSSRPRPASTTVLRRRRSSSAAKHPPIHSLGRSEHPPTADQVKLSGESNKIQKILAHWGVGSRRQVEAMLVAGRVAINGKPAELGSRATTIDKLAVDGRLITPPAINRQLLIYHKPRGKLVTREACTDTVFEDLPPLSHGRWISVGRLDCSTEGLLLFSTDGEWVNKMAHPSRGFEREYRVRADGLLSSAVLQHCRQGVALDKGRLLAVPHFELEHRGDGQNSWYRIILQEGRHRVVRRLFEKYGLQVSRLLRVRFGPYQLPSDLLAGQWREISSLES